MEQTRESAIGSQPPNFWPAEQLAVINPEWPGLRARYINGVPTGAWDEFLLSEWDLSKAGWADHHPHTETNVVVEGELYVESGGETKVLRPGDTAQVPVGSFGKYWAPRYARMVAVYGPNPNGAESEYDKYWDISE